MPAGRTHRMTSCSCKPQMKQTRKTEEDLRQAEEILLEELPIVPIYLSTKVYLKSPRVQGWYPNLEDVHPLKFVSLGAG